MANPTQSLVDEALRVASGQAVSDDSSLSSTAGTGDDAEVVASDELAESLTHLQNVIERNANELSRIDHELREKRESMQSVFENDVELAEATDQAAVASQSLKEHKTKIQNTPQVASLKVQMKELQEQKKELEETLSDHLVNYFQITQSKSFDTSDGDQWEFSIKAKVKARKG